MSKTLWITVPNTLLIHISPGLTIDVGGRCRLLYTAVMGMDTFLDRLLSDARGRPEPPADAGGGIDPAGTIVGARGSTTLTAAGRPAGDRAEHEEALAAGDRGRFAGPSAPRIAIYDTLTSPPRVVSVESAEMPQLMDALATETYRACREQGGQVPYTVIRELIENLIHASFRDVVVTVLENGQVLRISDHGPGIEDKERAIEPGFTTATADQRLHIRGVGSGLPIAKESLAFMQGVLTIEDNLGGGTVLTINLPNRAVAPPPAPRPTTPEPRLTTRQKRVLVLLMELGSAGPTAIGRELDIAAATAFRELGVLEKMGLIHSRGDGKRALTSEGVSVLDTIL